MDNNIVDSPTNRSYDNTTTTTSTMSTTTNDVGVDNVDDYKDTYMNNNVHDLSFDTIQLDRSPK